MTPTTFLREALQALPARARRAIYLGWAIAGVALYLLGQWNVASVFGVGVPAIQDAFNAATAIVGGIAVGNVDRSVDDSFADASYDPADLPSGEPAAEPDPFAEFLPYGHGGVIS